MKFVSSATHLLVVYVLSSNFVTRLLRKLYVRCLSEFVQNIKCCILVI